MSELFHVRAKNEHFTGDLRGNVCVRGDYHVYALSVAGHERAISFLSAALSKGEGGCSLTFDCCPALNPTPHGDVMKYDPGQQRSVKANETPFVLYPATGGFTCHRQHLASPDWRSDTWQLLAVSKDPKFLLDGGDEALWRALRGPQFTTPLLRAWVPEIRRALIERQFLKPCSGIGWQSQMLSLTDAGLDQLVSAGIQAGRLTFTPQALEEAA